jgi:DNA polymerase III epsilon subunit-like protein
MLTPVVIDFETRLDSRLSLKKMSLRRYLAGTDVTAVAIKIGDEPATAFIGAAEVQSSLPLLASLFQSDQCVIVGHNLFGFDLRVAHYILGLDWPKHARCTLAMARAAWPNLFKSYSLDSIAKSLTGCPKKLEINLHEGLHSDEELREYVARDADAAYYIYQAALTRIPEQELHLLEATGRACQLSLKIDRNLGEQALDQFTKIVTEHAAQAAKGLLAENSQDYASVFGLDGTNIKSIKPHGVKALLAENFGFQTNSISLKKMNPEKLRQVPEVGAALRSLGKANAALSHQRRVGALMRDDVVDLNLSYFGSHTGRWTSTGSGKGVNFLNLPKHDKAVAKPIRQMLSVEGKLLVRGDFSALEYRMNGWLCKCKYITDLFANDLFADPYVEFGFAATGKRCGKKDPIRQVWKTCVLGLGFLMGVRTHSLNLARMLGNALAESIASGKPPSITLADLEQICRDNGWHAPRGKYYATLRTQLGLPDAVVAVAHHTHALFHNVHPEMKRLADWLMLACETVSRGGTVAPLYQHPDAPDPARLLLELDRGMVGPSIQLTCGPWTPTLRWSNLGVRQTPFGPALCCITTRGDRKITPNVTLENVTQTGGRNGVSQGLLGLMDIGWTHLLNIHDEILIACNPDVNELRHARNSLVAACGPGGQVSNLFDWACVIKPSDITVSRTLWDEEPDGICPDFWKRIDAGDKTVLDLLP